MFVAVNKQMKFHLINIVIIVTACHTASFCSSYTAATSGWLVSTSLSIWIWTSHRNFGLLFSTMRSLTLSFTWTWKHIARTSRSVHNDSHLVLPFGTVRINASLYCTCATLYFNVCLSIYTQ